MNTFNLNLDLDKRGGVAQWVTLRQGDRNGTELRATIYDHGQQVGGGYTCRVSIRRPDVAEYYRETCNYSNGVATVTVDERYAAARAGSTYGYFELLQGGTVIVSTESFGVRILPDATADAEVGPEYDSAIDDALAELDEATGRISQMVQDATAEYLEAHPELTTTVEDNSLTDAKLIQHGGILDRVARLWHRLDNLLTATPAESDSLTVTDAAKTPMAGLALYGRSTQDGTPTPSAPVAIQSVTPNLYHQTAYGAGETKTAGGVQITFIDGCSFIANGTGTGTAAVWGSTSTTSASVYVTVPAGTYTAHAPAPFGITVRKLVDGTNTAVDSSQDGTVTFTFDTETQVLIYPYMRVNVVYDNAHGWVTLTKGTEPLLPYVPYGGVNMWSRGANLSPLFSEPIGAGSYWTNYSSYWTSTSDGWARFTRSVTSATNSDIAVWPQVGFEVGQTYTILLEWRNVSLTGSATMFQSADATRQLDTIESTTITAGSGSSIRTTTCLHGPTDAGITRFFFWRTRLQANSSLDGEFRLSIYKGEYAGGYQPYAESTTPIDLQGHELRSLPDGTRDEVTVDAYGHAVLTQRVGEIVLDGSENWSQSSTANIVYRSLSGARLQSYVDNALCDHFAASLFTLSNMADPSFKLGESGGSTTNELLYFKSSTVATDVASIKAWLAENPTTVLYPLADPVTIDLGTIDPIALQGPDMTAQAVPTAPFALTYERDLNTTLARLEAAIAEVATS